MQKNIASLQLWRLFCVYNFINCTCMNLGISLANITTTALQKNRLLPVTTTNSEAPIACSRCLYVNPSAHHYCTNCGFPIIPDENCVSAYEKRLKELADIKSLCNMKISYARNTLYVLAACCALSERS